MMSRMRSLAPWFILTVGGLFVVFMVLSDSRVLETFQSRQQDVGSVNGEEITYQEYNQMVETARKNQEQSSGQSIDESQMDYFRDQIWDMLVTKKIVDKKIAEYGIIVSDEEVREAILGPNPPAMLKQQFTDSTGNFNRQAYESALKDPRNKDIVINVEQQIKDQLIQEKLQNYLFASITATDEEAKDNFIKRNIKMRAEFVKIDANLISDNDVKVSDADIQKYYDDNQEEFKVENQRKLKYVMFQRQASQKDTIAVKNNLEAIAKKLKADTASFKSYVQIYSEQPYKKDTVALTSLSSEAKSQLTKAAKGTIVGPVNSNEGFVIYNLLDKVASKNPQARASHILVKSTGNDAADLKKATDIYNEVKAGADFAKVAQAKSDDGSKFQGGDVGFGGKDTWVKPFADACLSGAIGVVQKPVKSQFGYHVIKVTEKSNQDFVVEKIVNKVKESATTSDKTFQDATDFTYVSKENGFESEAKILKYTVLETPPFNEEAVGIPGLGMNKALVKWSFESGVGDVSDLYRFPQGYVVAFVSEVIKAGVKPLEEVKALIKAKVTTERKLEKAMAIAKQIKGTLGSNGDKNLAKQINQGVIADTTSEFTTAGNVGNLGREFAFSETAVKAEVNKWTNPVKGTNAVYLIKVSYRTPFNEATFNFEKQAIKGEVIRNKKNMYLSQWIEKLKKEADITDKRYVYTR